MAEVGPPRLASGERETLMESLQYQRDSLLRNVDGLDEGSVRAPLVGSGTTLIWLVRHVRYAELVWLVQRFAADDADIPDPSIDDGTLAEAVEAYRRSWERVDAIVAVSSLDDLCRNDPIDPPVNLRWVLVHLIEEIGRHAGHADILRELIDGRTGR